MVMGGRLNLRDSLKCFVFFQNEKCFERVFEKVTWKVLVLEEHEDKGYPEWYALVFCRRATGKGESVLSLGDRKINKWGYPT